MLNKFFEGNYHWIIIIAVIIWLLSFLSPDYETKKQKEKRLKKEAEERKAKEEKAFKEQQEKVKEQQRLEYNRRTAQKQQRLVHWCNAYDQGNYLNIHSEEYRRKTNKINNTRSYY